MYARMVLKFLGCFAEEKKNIKFLLASFAALSNSKDCSES
jgi:hypothetical protein